VSEGFYAVVTAAIDDLLEHGFDSQERLDRWLQQIGVAARAALVPEAVLQRALRDALVRVFHRSLTASALARRHPGLDTFTLASIKPKLHSELDRRIVAAADLIKLNRAASVQRTLQRFAGWASSIPAGGTEVGKRKEIKRRVRRGIAGLPFAERRVIVDQGAKLAASIDAVIAMDGGSIAGIWHSHWREAGYDYREDHKERDGHVFVVRDNWALQRKYMKLAGAQYMDQVTAPAQEPFCRCRYAFLYNLRDLPNEMLTELGAKTLARVRRQIRVTKVSASTLSLQ
jgi:hypothetical protein